MNYPSWNWLKKRAVLPPLCFNMSMDLKRDHPFFKYLGGIHFLSLLAAVLILMALAVSPAPASAGEKELLCALPNHITPKAQTEWQPYPGLSAGKLLVATRQLEGPIFQKTVILLISYDKDGALGLILNRPSEMPLLSFFPDSKELKKRSDKVFFGGPVGMDRLFLLVAADKQPLNSTKVLDGVYASSSSETLKSIAGQTDAVFRAYLGYAGWGPGQLESELERNSWYIHPADSETVFSKTPKALWPALIKKSGIEAEK